MKLVIFNGSPRGKQSNSSLLIENFLKGYTRISPEVVPVHYLAGKKKSEMWDAFGEAETVLLFFPLYTDCMPGIVKEFIEGISRVNQKGPKKIGFVVQSGFPESIHSVYVERYNEKLARRLGLEYLGTVIKGGVEGIRIMPPMMTKKLFARFQSLGEEFAQQGEFSLKIIKALRKPYKMSRPRRFFFGLMIKTGWSNFYWNSMLKKHHAYNNRFEAPYR